MAGSQTKSEKYVSATAGDFASVLTPNTMSNLKPLPKKKKKTKSEESLSLCFYYKVRTELDGALRRPKTPFINLSVRHQNLAQNSLK